MRYRQAMGNAFDVLTFLAFAAVLGLGVGTVLGVLALVLASPAHAAGEAAAGRLLLHRPSSESAVAAPMASSETTFRADGPILRVRVTQAFRNPFRERQEGLYVIQLPEHATLDRLAVRVQPEADEADDEAAAEPVEPTASLALLAGIEGADVISRAIAGIEPGEAVLIELEYQLVARYDRGRPGLRMLTALPFRALGMGRRRRARVNEDAFEDSSVPLGVEAAWKSAPAEGAPGAPWLWLLPVVALYVAVAFFS